MAEPGTRFGPYEIVEPIGAGGMGEVYRATDTALEREVAIKILPESFVDDAERVARFEREAKTLAALNHYNIAHIYGLEQSGGVTALVMELVEGPTLAERIRQGPVALDEASGIARQVAAALEAAHERGIVHRDLKPANIKVRPDGTVKVLDFGLAKTIEGPGSVSTDPAPVLTTPALTEVGRILGTAAYMSPEQARGKPLDRRADIWAFGAVLYEMLSGQPAFLGEDVTETVAAVLKSEPAWSALPPLPAQLEAMLRQCLVKDPKRRVHDIADVRLAIEGAYRWSRAEASAPGEAAAKTPRLARLGWAVALALGLAAGAAAVRYRSDDTGMPADPPSVRQLTFRNGQIGGARFASDGQVVVYGAAWDDEPFRVYTTRLDGYQSRPLDVPPASLLGLSANGELALALDHMPGSGFGPDGVLARVALAGGAPRELANAVTAADWGPDGELAALVRRSSDGAELEFPLGTVAYRSATIVGPRVSPDGAEVCFAVDYGSVMVANLEGSARTLAEPLPRASGCAWSPDGEEVWFSYSPSGATHASIEAVRRDGSGRRVIASMPSWAQIEDVSPKGDILMAAGAMRFSVHGAQSLEAREIDLAVFDASRLAFLSGSGDTVVLSDNSVGARASGTVFLRPTDGRAPVQLGSWNAMALTPDGRWLAILGTMARSPGSSDTITLVPTGAGEPRELTLPVTVEYSAGNNYGTNDWRIKYPDFSVDGRRLLLPFARDGAGAPRAYVHDLDEGWTRPVTPPGITGPVVLSPDGHSVASNEEDGLWVFDVESGERHQAPGGPDPGLLARWSFDAEFVYLIEPYATGARLFRRSLATGKREFLRDIAAPDPAGVMRFDLWIARDGGAYAYTLDRINQNLYVLQNVH